MIPFKDIYQKAVNLFDDPDIHKAYITDTIKFQKKMYAHFQNGIALFTNPVGIAAELVDQEMPEGTLDIFEGDGGSTYELSAVPHENAEFSFRIAGTPDEGAIYDAEENTVTFSQEIPLGTSCSAEWYYAGAFNSDFEGCATSRISAAQIIYYVKEILARALILAWAEREKNFVLDIRNILTDTDFRIYSPANAVRAKIEWVKDLRAQFDNLQTKLGWQLFAHTRGGGRKYGP